MFWIFFMGWVTESSFIRVLAWYTREFSSCFWSSVQGFSISLLCFLDHFNGGGDFVSYFVLSQLLSTFSQLRGTFSLAKGLFVKSFLKFSKFFFPNIIQI
ncbi:hypothetical protein F2P56_033120 [Juglans regia]|uniref:Uncharacterized protein n=1 Tax=Juglans regia TaxID=51240 RepID=A0A833WVN0_JUGRE|nr:hypothetical protein F2P56_033120 [Juglans regia]